MRALVTGHDGFIGRNLLPRLANFGYGIIGHELGDPHPHPEIADVDVVINLAAIPDVSQCERDPIGAIANNIGFAADLMRLMSDDAVFVQMSSMAVARGVRNVYTITKRAAEELAKHRGRSLIVRASNVYGPYAWHKSSVVAALMRQAAAGRALELTAPASTKRDFVYVGDVCDRIIEGIDEVLELEPDEYVVLNANSGDERTLGELVEAIEHVSTAGAPPWSAFEESIAATWEWFAAEYRARHDESEVVQ